MEASTFEDQPLSVFAERAYLDYSMYVVLDRALPHLADGLKPVQRRIIYAMSELGIVATAKHRKSALTVGDVIGKFHPHGDSACYEAMVTMAQPFAYRHPLVDGQGNWGSPDDPKSFAAYRYTESRLTPYAQALLGELGQGTVDWSPTFDGTRDEPKLLPARTPNILVNGTTGIAVGMATDIPPHNLRELIAACRMMLVNPTATLADVQALVPAPDYPTGCEIVNTAAELRKMYETGLGQMRLRARWVQEDDGNIAISNFPHQVSPSTIQQQIAEQMREKRLPLIEDLRDESDHENPTRLVIIPRAGKIEAATLMEHLYATTDLEKNIRVNLNMIGLDGRPRVKGLVDILGEWLRFREATVRRRLEHRLAKLLDRLHILDGLLVAFLNIDEVIRIIRQEEDPKAVMMAKFGLTDRQVDAILDLRLRALQKLEEVKIRGEQSDLAAERDRINELLANRPKLITLIGDELANDAVKYGDDRRSTMVERQQAQALSQTEITPVEPVTVVLSKAGWIRVAKGHNVDGPGLGYKAGDSFLCAIEGRSNNLLVLMDNRGRAYTLNPRELPSARGQGEPVTSRIDLQNGATPYALLMGDSEKLYLFAGSDGYGFLAKLDDLHGRKRAGKDVVTLNATLLLPLAVNDAATDRFVMVNGEGKMLAIAVSEMPELSKGKGNKLMTLRDDDSIVASLLLPAGKGLRIVGGGKSVDLTPQEVERYHGTRATRGLYLPNSVRTAKQIKLDLF